MIWVGVISDTHGLLRPTALTALEGVDLILHAGDVGSPDILPALAALAPVRAVRGNVDYGAWANRLPLTEAIELDGLALFMYHGHLEPGIDPRAGGFGIVVSGHSHQPSIERRAGILYLNPGSAGPRRFRQPVSLARLSVVAAQADAELIDLAAPG